MPVAGYDSYDHCVRMQMKNGKSRESAEKICGYLKKKLENTDRMIDEEMDLSITEENFE